MKEVGRCFYHRATMIYTKFMSQLIQINRYTLYYIFKNWSSNIHVNNNGDPIVVTNRECGRLLLRGKDAYSEVPLS